jgi:hypothetical protein
MVFLSQRPKGRNFERDSYKIALKIAPAENFLLNVQPELRQDIEKKVSFYVVIKASIFNFLFEGSNT